MLSYQSIQTHTGIYQEICPGDVWACHATTPPHDNTYDGMIIHRPICRSTHFQTCSEWNRHVGPRACDLIIGTKMAARLPSCDSTITPPALKVTYYLAVQCTDRLRFPISHEMTQDARNHLKLKTAAQQQNGRPAEWTSTEE